jgi:hypothetical protein
VLSPRPLHEHALHAHTAVVAAALATPGTKRAEVRSASVKGRIQRSITARRGEVVLRRDLVRFGGDAALQGQAADLAVGRERLPDYAE